MYTELFKIYSNFSIFTTGYLYYYYNNNGLINVSNFIKIENNTYEIILILILMVCIPFQMAAWPPRSINHQIPILHYG